MSSFDDDICRIKSRIKTTRALGGDVHFTDKGRNLRNRVTAAEQAERIASVVDESLRQQDRWFVALLSIPVMAALARALGWL